MIDAQAATRLSAVIRDGEFDEQVPEGTSGHAARGFGSAPSAIPRAVPATAVATLVIACLWASGRDFTEFSRRSTHAATVGGSFTTSRAAVGPMFGAGRDPGTRDGDQAMSAKNRMRAAVVVAAAATGSALAQDAVQWRVEDGGNGHWYQGMVAPNPSWSSARAASRDLGGDLVSLNDVAESDWVYSNVASDPTLWISRMGPWIGLYQPPGSSEPDGGWVWCDGTPLGWTNWMPDHPHNGWSGGPECDYVKYMSWPPIPMNQWGADSDVHFPPYHGEQNRSWIVEWSEDCNADGIVDFGQLLDGTLADDNGNGRADVCERFRMIDLAPWANVHRANGGEDPSGFWYGATYPSGIQSYDGIPISHGTDLAYGYSAIPEFHGGVPGTITLPVDLPAGMNIHLALNIWARWPVGSCDSSLSVVATVTMSDGSAMTFDLRGGEHLRDHNQSWSGGGICSPTAPFVREVWRNGTDQVIDLVTLAVPAGPSRVASIRLDSPDFGFWTFLLGATVEPTADCNGDGVSDFAQVTTGVLLDNDGDLLPDECECLNNPSLPACCVGDIYRNGIVDGADLGILLSEWGPVNPSTNSDLDGNGDVNGADLGLLLANWGACGG
jgi:hypothetical protein